MVNLISEILLLELFFCLFENIQISEIRNMSACSSLDT